MQPDAPDEQFQEEPAVADEFATEPEAPELPPDRASAWTLPLLCAGIAIIASCLLIPAADDNRQLVYQREKLKADLTQVERQIAVNDEFLKRVADDPNLLERLAQRQMKMVREGTSVLELPHDARQHRAMSSPYLLLSVPAPEPLVAGKPIGGHFADLIRKPRTRLLFMGGGLMMIAVGLVMGTSTSESEADSVEPSGASEPTVA